MRMVNTDIVNHQGQIMIKLIAKVKYRYKKKTHTSND